MDNVQKININYTSIKILTGSDLSKKRIPYMSIKSNEVGPVIWLTGCMHGDEIGGTVIIHEVFKRLKKTLKRGSIHALPIMNPFGFENASRNVTFSREDLNRSFPGYPKGTSAQRIANIVYNQICNTQPTLVLDLHNDWNKSIPYVIIDPLLMDGSMNEKIFQYASLTGLLKIQETEIISTSLTYNLINNNIPALTLEFGESLTINERNIDYGIKTIMNILKYFNMVENSGDFFRYPLPEDVHGKIFKYSSLPLCSSSGIIRFLKKPGEKVQKGQKIARIYNAFGKLIETVTASQDGIILGHTDYAVAFPGFPIMAFGIFE